MEKARSPKEYLDALAPERRERLEAIRRVIAQTATAAADATLSESTPPVIGIVTIRSAASSAASDSPSPSVPITRATRSGALAA